MFGSNYKAGEFLKFAYHAEVPYGEKPSDLNKEVLVLHPLWQNEMHAIDLGRLTLAQKEVLMELFDEKTYQANAPQSRFPLVEDVKRRMNVLEEVKNPVSFYVKFVKVFLKGADAYRRYNPAHMTNVKVIKHSEVKGKVTNPKPLFRKV